MNRRGFFSVSLLVLLLGASCALRNPPESLPALERSWPERERVFRQAIRIDFPGETAPFSFDGVLQLTLEEGDPTARVIGLGALGLTLFDITVTTEGHRTDFLHPALAGIPEAAEHVALCVRSVWFVSLPPVGLKADGQAVLEVYHATLAEHTREKDGRRTVRALGPEYCWTVGYSPAIPQPALILFRNDLDGYTVRIRFIAEQGGPQP
jgi:hypothetical protein